MNRSSIALTTAALAAGLALVGCEAPGDNAGPASSSTASSGVPSTTVDHADDVKITSCAPDEYGYVQAGVTVTNTSSKPSTYSVTIVFESPDKATQIGTGLVFVDRLAPGQSTPQTASALEKAAGAYVCSVGDVTRYAS